MVGTNVDRAEADVARQRLIQVLARGPANRTRDPLHFVVGLLQHLHGRARPARDQILLRRSAGQSLEVLLEASHRHSQLGHVSTQPKRLTEAVIERPPQLVRPGVWVPLLK